MILPVSFRVSTALSSMTLRQHWTAVSCNGTLPRTSGWNDSASAIRCGRTRPLRSPPCSLHALIARVPTEVQFTVEPLRTGSR